MEADGGCYCGAVRYHVSGEFGRKLLCFCRECQVVSGGAGTVAGIIDAAGFSYTQGEPGRYTRPDLPAGVTREFCTRCGTQLAARLARTDAIAVLKIGTLDDPSVFGQADMVYYTSEKQAYHTCPEGVPAFEKFPPQ